MFEPYTYLKKKNKDNKVYTVLGDGECNEGSVWEAAMAASNYKLDNLFAIIDKNKIDILHDPKMLAGEILSGEEFYNFLENYNLSCQQVLLSL